MRRIWAATLLAALFLAGCSGGSAGIASSSAEPGEVLREASIQEIPGYHVGVLQSADHPALNAVRDAVTLELSNMVTDQPVTYTFRDGGGSDDQMIDSCLEFVERKVDLIIAISTPAAKAAAEVTDTVPIVCAAVSDPEGAGLLGKRNVTGAYLNISPANVLDLAAQLTPEATRFGMLYNPEESGSVLAVNKAKTWLTAREYSFAEAEVSTGAEVYDAVREISGKVDALYLPPDNTVAPVTPVLAEAAKQLGLPLYSSASAPCQDGGFAAVGADLNAMSQSAGDIAELLLHGASPAEIPSEYFGTDIPYINVVTARELGIELPEALPEGTVTVGNTVLVN